LPSRSRKLEPRFCAVEPAEISALICVGLGVGVGTVGVGEAVGVGVGVGVKVGDGDGVCASAAGVIIAGADNRTTAAATGFMRPPVPLSSGFIDPRVRRIDPNIQ
jgi:hypothetical protein